MHTVGKRPLGQKRARTELNHEPADLQSAALPLSYTPVGRQCQVPASFRVFGLLCLSSCLCALAVEWVAAFR